MISERKTILILRPASTTKGGIKNYYSTLFGKFSIPVEFFIRGARNWPYKKSKIKEFSRLIRDYFKFFTRISSGEIELVQTSTSLYKYTIIRDGIFLWLAQKKGIKTIVFFRGWDQKFEKKLEKKYIEYFKKIYFRTDSSIVLSEQFKHKLEQWGYKKPIYVETTVVDSELFNGVELDLPEKRSDQFKNIGLRNLLFLARVEKEKGIYEAIDAYTKVKILKPYISLTIAGDGVELNRIKKFVVTNSIHDVKILGYINGEERTKAFLDADIYLFPSYTEGMPNSVLEAMAFGLPIIGTPVGGLEEIFIDYKTGFRVPVKDSEYFSTKLIELINSPHLATKISHHNYNYAKAKFTPERVIERMERIFINTLNNNK